MQKIDRPGVDFHQHVLSDQLIEIMAGGISLHRETPGQPAGGKDLAQVIRIEKIGLILQKSQQFRLRIASPSSPLRRDMMREKRGLSTARAVFLRSSAHSLSRLRVGQIHRHFILLQRERRITGRGKQRRKSFRDRHRSTNAWNRCASAISSSRASPGGGRRAPPTKTTVQGASPPSLEPRRRAVPASRPDMAEWRR